MKTAFATWKHFQRIGMALVMAALFVVALSLPSLACGFHTLIFRGDFASDWTVLKPRMIDSNQRQLVITELLSILRFVDTYNYAPDSPPWMATEEGRTNARNNTVEILHELGGKAAEKVWEALADDFRFETAESRKALHKAHVDRDKIQQSESDLRVYLSKNHPKVFEEINAPPPGPDDKLLYNWTAQVTRLGIMEVPKQIYIAASPDGKIHRRVPRHRVHHVEFRNNQRHLLTVGYDPTTKSDPVVLNFLALLDTLGSSLYSSIKEYHLVMGRNGKSVGGGNMSLDPGLVPCDDYRGDLETVLVRIGKDALPILERGALHSHKDVAAKAAQLIQAIKAQPKPLQLGGLKTEESVRLANVALEIWDLGDSRGASHIAARALAELKARSEGVYADLFALHRSKKLNLQREVLTALEKLSGKNFGNDLTAWMEWHEKRLEAERNTPLPKELSPENLVIAPTRPPSTDEVPKQKTEAVKPPLKTAE